MAIVWARIPAPATCTLTVVYPNGSSAVIGSETAAPDTVYLWYVEWTWIVPAHTAGYATGTYACAAVNRTVSADITFMTTDPNPLPVFDVLTSPARPVSPGGTGEILSHVSDSVYEPFCTTTISYLDGRTTVLQGVHPSFQMSWTWSVPADVPLGNTPYTVSCTKSGVTETASALLSIVAP